MSEKKAEYQLSPRQVARRTRLQIVIVAEKEYLKGIARDILVQFPGAQAWLTGGSLRLVADTERVRAGMLTLWLTEAQRGRRIESFISSNITEFVLEEPRPDMYDALMAEGEGKNLDEPGMT